MTKRMQEICHDMAYALNGKVFNIAQPNEVWVKLNNGTEVCVLKVGSSVPFDESPLIHIPFYGEDNCMYCVEDDLDEDEADALYDTILEIDRREMYKKDKQEEQEKYAKIMAKGNFMNALQNIRHSADMGYISPLRAIIQLIDVLHVASEGIEDPDEREAWEQSVYDSHAKSEHLFNAWRELAEQWIGE